MSTDQFLATLLGTEPTQAQSDLFQKNAIVITEPSLIIQGDPDDPNRLVVVSSGSANTLSDIVASAIISAPRIKHICKIGISKSELLEYGK